MAASAGTMCTLGTVTTHDAVIKAVHVQHPTNGRYISCCVLCKYNRWMYKQYFCKIWFELGTGHPQPPLYLSKEHSTSSANNDLAMTPSETETF